MLALTYIFSVFHTQLLKNVRKDVCVICVYTHINTLTHPNVFSFILYSTNSTKKGTFFDNDVVRWKIDFIDVFFVRREEVKSKEHSVYPIGGKLIYGTHTNTHTQTQNIKNLKENIFNLPGGYILIVELFIWWVYRVRVHFIT